MQGKRFVLDFDLARLQLRIIQHVVDHRHQVLGRLSCVVQNFLPRRALIHPVHEHGVEAQNGIHRRAHFVANVGNELFTQSGCPQQFLAFLLQFNPPLQPIAIRLAVQNVIQNHHPNDQQHGHCVGAE